MNTSYKITTALLVSLLIMFSCQKKPTDYRSFLNGEERIYPGIVANAKALPGNGRLMLTWSPNPDPSVTKYVIYYNNNADSLVVNATSHNPLDTVKAVINNLAEYAYAFFIYSYDAAGNRSVTTEINNARVYGAIYQAALHNRLPNGDNPYIVNDDGSVVLNFTTPDTINITTLIKYTNAAGQPSTANLAPDASSITLPSYKSGEPVVYQSSYIPLKGAIDTFKVSRFDTMPDIFKIVQADKSLFMEMRLPGDPGYYNEAPLRSLWNGTVGPQDWPNVYHVDGSQPMPLEFSFDMGATYPLTSFEETGRTCCHNPDRFEVWGIADTTGAIQTLPSQNAGWKDETIAKGWSLLADVTRTDDGNATMKFNTDPAAPPVRFIRVRVFHVTSGSNTDMNIAEMTFFYKK
jgi:Domain of unknown function